MGDLSSNNTLPRLLLPAKLCFQTVSHCLSVLVDSGAEQNFIDTSLASKLNITLETLPNPLHVHALSSQRLPSITHVSEPLSLSFEQSHREKFVFWVFKAPPTPLVLGHPWLVLHNPHIDWEKGKIMGWSVNCHMHCLRAATPPISSQPTTVPLDPPDLSAVPRIYHDLRRFFVKIGRVHPPPPACTMLPLMSFPGPHCLPVGFTTSLSLRETPWRSTLPSHSRQV